MSSSADLSYSGAGYSSGSMALPAAFMTESDPASSVSEAASSVQLLAKSHHGMPGSAQPSATLHRGLMLADYEQHLETEARAEEVCEAHWQTHAEYTKLR